MTLRKREQAVQGPRPFLTPADRSLVSLCREQCTLVLVLERHTEQRHSNGDEVEDYTWPKLYQMRIRGLYFSGHLSTGS